MKRVLPYLPLSFFSLSLLFSTTFSFPLYTDSRWIVDKNGHRVKLACVSWASHMEAVIAEGLNKQPVNAISRKIASMGFNCVRLTWPIYLATNDTLANTRVRQSFQNYGLNDASAGFQANNPSMIDLTLMQTFQAVVASLTKNHVMVILDNHVSKPIWCCDENDGNGFFGDQYFDPNLWIQGLTKMATLFKDNPNVVGMSLRNELRGSRENCNDWHRYMSQGAEAVHGANPNVLVIFSGLNYDTTLSFLNKSRVNVTFVRKTVFEVHRYSFTDGSNWSTGNPNEVCGQVMNTMETSARFLLDQGYPLFMSEFGVNQNNTSVDQNRYLNCFMSWFAEFDLDWALWGLAGSYYLKQGVIGPIETYGILDQNWSEVQNSSLLARFTSIQSPFRGPGVLEAQPHQVLYHPLTGLCIQRKLPYHPLKLGPCTGSEAWIYTQQKTLTIKDTKFCLQALELTKPAILGKTCTSKWDKISNSEMHFSSNLNDGNNTVICLDVDLRNNIIVTNTCKCLSGDSTCDPSTQWFKMVDSTRAIGGRKD